jgi:hypothetical protein
MRSYNEDLPALPSDDEIVAAVNELWEEHSPRSAYEGVSAREIASRLGMHGARRLGTRSSKGNWSGKMPAAVRVAPALRRLANAGDLIAAPIDTPDRSARWLYRPAGTGGVQPAESRQGHGAQQQVDAVDSVRTRTPNHLRHAARRPATPAAAAARRAHIRTLEYRWAGLPIDRDGLIVHVYDTTSPSAKILHAVDVAHARNDGGRHHTGFCRACADLYTDLNRPLLDEHRA